MSDGHIVTVEGSLLDIERVPNSVDGNPRFNVMLSGGYLHVTEHDAAVNHKIAGWDVDSLRHQKMRMTLRWSSRLLAFRIIDIEPVNNVVQSGKETP